MSKLIQLKSCPRCSGDMMLEQYPGDSELVCLQCGHRSSVQPQVKPALSGSAARNAA